MAEVGAIELARNLYAPCRARRAVSEWVGRDHAALELVVLVASELVTNAVQHADIGSDRRWILILLSRGDNFFRLAVTDPGSTFSKPYLIPLHLPSLSQRGEDGRGLAIVAKLAQGRWGSHTLPHSRHRVVWCHLDTDLTTAQAEAGLSIAV